MIVVAAVALTTALGTWIVGWWAVALVAVVAGAVLRAENGRPWRVALGCLAGWALLMLIDATAGPMLNVATVVSGAIRIPPAALLVVTLLFPALMGWSGATLGASGSGVSPRVRGDSV